MPSDILLADDDKQTYMPLESLVGQSGRLVLYESDEDTKIRYRYREMLTSVCVCLLLQRWTWNMDSIARWMSRTTFTTLLPSLSW